VLGRPIVHGDRPQEGHLAVGLTTYGIGDVLPAYTKQQHWLSSEMLGVRRLIMPSLVSNLYDPRLYDPLGT